MLHHLAAFKDAQQFHGTGLAADTVLPGPQPSGSASETGQQGQARVVWHQTGLGRGAVISAMPAAGNDDHLVLTGPDARELVAPGPEPERSPGAQGPGKTKGGP